MNQAVAIQVEPVTLALNGVRLEPLTLAHADGLRAAARDGELWNLRVTSVPEPEHAEQYIRDALGTPTRLPFAVIDAASGAVIGSTSYHDIVAPIGRLEIGYTWYAKRHQRSHVNTSCKLMLMAHAFDTLGASMVGLRTDVLNLTSQAAIERLGAQRDGVLRHHHLRRDGSVRDTIMYSMLRAEWPAIRARLQARLARG
ncbi:MAG: GNAT family protein [Pseudomonadota bacterium]